MAPAPGTTTLSQIYPCYRHVRTGSSISGIRAAERSAILLVVLVVVIIVADCPIGRNLLSQDHRRICGKCGRRASEDAASIGSFVRDGNQVAFSSSRHSTLSSSSSWRRNAVTARWSANRSLGIGNRRGMLAEMVRLSYQHRAFYCYVILSVWIFLLVAGKRKQRAIPRADMWSHSKCRDWPCRKNWRNFESYCSQISTLRVDTREMIRIYLSATNETTRLTSYIAKRIYRTRVEIDRVSKTGREKISWRCTYICFSDFTFVEFFLVCLNLSILRFYF